MEENKAFAEKFDFPYPLLCDRDRTMGLAYGAASEAGVGGYAARIGVVIDPNGRIIYYQEKVDVVAFPQLALTLVS